MMFETSSYRTVDFTSSGGKPAEKLEHFAEALRESSDAPTLFVFDNFETVRSPLEMCRWLDTYIRLPNKSLITTRSREFKGDYWVEVGGMTEDQFGLLVRQAAESFGVADLVDSEYRAQIHTCVTNCWNSIPTRSAFSWAPWSR